ncbi:UDP-glucose--polyglycerol phosphate alpha-glucosyltransferase, partial [Xanthomonas citri pv. citri]|nr:UDP-glucose--polyglycerol phosphate alpha-glucosyltransferase [Xanthomonas citri pv. citri]
DKTKIEIDIENFDHNDIKKIRLVGLDRKNKAEIISTNLQNDQLFVIDLEKDVNIEKIAANKTQVIDFYIVFNANGHIKTMRRLSSEETKLSGNSIDTNNGY